MTLPGAKEVLRALEGSSRGPLKAKDLASELAVPKHRYRDFRAFLRDLEAAGRLYRVKGNRYAVPKKINLVMGRLGVIRSGDAFLRPDDPGDGEVFIPATNLDSAMDGDRVAVRIESRPRGRKPVGRVIRVLERARQTVVGTYRPSRDFGVVAPQDRKVNRDVFIPPGKEGNARKGDVVVARIVAFGDRSMNPVGEVETVLGQLEAPGVDVLAILHGHGLPRAFSPEVEKEAEALQKSVRPGEVAGRTDLRNLRVFTIDPADARDHDDALSLMPVEEGVWEVGIHIADVSHYVAPGSLLDVEAYRRGTSVYLVDQVVPMLPHTLSSDLCSLRPDQDRLALSLFCTLDGEGRVRKHRLERSVIRSRHKLAYEEVEEILGGRASVDPGLDGDLSTLAMLARALRARRRTRGSLDFDLPEARVELDADGVPVDIQRTVRLESHRLIEDMMLMANEVVARLAEAKKLPIPFRVHEPPEFDRLQELRDFLASVGQTLPRGRISGQELQAVLDRVEGRPEQNLVNTVILRAMKKARYSPDNVGHFGLGSSAYAHFTSPIRRYPDLVVHRVLAHAHLDSRPVPEEWAGEALLAMTEHASDREETAQKAERDSVDLKKIEFMERHLGDDFTGTIAGVTSFGLFILLDDYFVEGLVHVSSLEDDYYQFHQEAYSLVGERTGRRFRLGDRARVRVLRVDKEERHIDFLHLGTAN